LIDITETYGCSQAAKLLKEFQSSLVLGVEVDYRDYTNEWVKAQIAVARGCGSTACIGLCRVKVVADTWLPPMKTGLRYSPFLYCNPCFAAQHVFGFCVYFQRDSARLAAAESMVQVDSGVFDDADPEVTHSP